MLPWPLTCTAVTVCTSGTFLDATGARFESVDDGRRVIFHDPASLTELVSNAHSESRSWRRFSLNSASRQKKRGAHAAAEGQQSLRSGRALKIPEKVKGVQHLLAEGSPVPFPLWPKPTKAEMQRSIAPVCPGLCHPQGMLGPDAASLLSSHGTVCSALSNALAQKECLVVHTT